MPDAAPVESLQDSTAGSGLKLRAMSLGIALGVCGLIFWGISRTQRVAVSTPMPEIEDMRAYIITPPPPPPSTKSEELPPPSPIDIEPVPEPESISVTSIPMDAAPMSAPEVEPDLNLDLSAFRPRSSVIANDPNYIFKKTQVDRPPVTIYRKSMRDIPPEVLKRVDVPKVTLMFVINKDGTVENVRLLGSQDPEFDALVMEAVEYWRFKPALKDGKPVRCWSKTRFTVRSPAIGSRFSL